MKRLTTILFSCLVGASPLLAQQGVTQCGTPTGQPPYPLNAYQELPDPSAPSPEAWASVKTPRISWGSTDVRYAKHNVPVLKQQNVLRLQAWRGERVNAQALVWSGAAMNNFTYSLSEFKNAKGDVLPADVFKVGMVRYVMTDELNKDGRGACGYRPDHTVYDSLLVADGIDHLLKTISLPAMTVQPVWMGCQIPQAAQPGTYKGDLIMKEGDRILGSLKLEINVSSRILPAPSDWAYHLDLWQSPFAVARYYQVPLWSKEHLEAMRPVMKLLADAGQKIITATIMHKPWNGQTEDYFETMVTWMKKADGTWAFDFTVFDKWVEFMMSVGIDKQINCYSMVPWELSFQYFDQASNSLKFVKTAPGEEAYREMWTAMLASFSKHLREKGWFDICTIAMDERPMDVMQKTLKVIREADPEFKVSLAGNYHQELEADIYDYCIPIGNAYPKEILERRAKENLPTTYYTCCTEAFPNTFTFSEPAEAAWMSYYSAKDHLDGYLRWAYNSWPKEPLLDSRFSAWAGGDTYLVYPGARSSIRFEKLIEGVQAHEKITILRREFMEKGNKAGLKKLDKMLSIFNLKDFPQVPAAITVNKANKILNSF